MAKTNPAGGGNREDRGVVLAMVLLTAVITGSGAGLLSWLGGTPVALAILTAFAAFGGTTIFILTVLRYVRP
ncbi:hypothetical protein [Amycolatopsis sp. lyj-346]|uniref:hypothetical protein n=1 Tax=Amycolatopsis sp. lyj-346 TaxID=2789289 RepID=UPI00397CE9F0